ncbi:MAG: hypothetical protein HY432_01490 [Candidatus Liptonbacteria bacterium]|nr:hypothetical protein [Candidatus Liptonbacteria bacterium]
MRKKIIIFASIATIFVGAVALLNSQSLGAKIVWNLSGEGSWLLPLVTVSALLDSINPCAFSILLVTIAFLFSLGASRSGIIKIGAAYIAGIFMIYLLIGLGIIQTLHLFNTPHFMAKVGASLLLLFGAINVVSVLFPTFPIKLRIPQTVHGKIAELMEKASAPTAFLLGALVGICEFPCTGGPYLMVLGLLHDQATYFRGFGYLLFYNLIFVLPLVVILFAASDRDLLEKVKEWKNRENRDMRLWTGIAMVALGLIIFIL